MVHDIETGTIKLAVDPGTGGVIAMRRDDIGNWQETSRFRRDELLELSRAFNDAHWNNKAQDRPTRGR